jgi:hypothetical protein
MKCLSKRAKENYTVEAFRNRTGRSSYADITVLRKAVITDSPGDKKENPNQI